MAEIPSADELKRTIIGEKGEKWLQEKIKDHEATFGGSVEDPALKLWMIARANGIDVADIRAEDASQEGTPLQIVDLTDERVREEIDASARKEGGIYSVGPCLVTSDVESGETSKGKAKVFFYVQDQTMKSVKVVSYTEEGNQKVANARLKQGMVVKLPQVSVFAGVMTDEKSGEERLWKQLTIPPFGRVEVIEGMDFRAFYKDPNTSPVADGDAIVLQGIVTVLDAKKNDTCSECGRWVLDGKEEQHKNCGQYEVVEEVAWEGTMATGNGQTYKFTIPAYRARDGQPDIVIATGLSRLFGAWNGKYKNLKVTRWETITGSKGAAPARKAPSVATTAATTVKATVAVPAKVTEAPKKAAPAPAKVAPPVVPTVNPDNAVNPTLASAIVRAVKKLNTDGKGAPWEDVMQMVVVAGLGTEAAIEDAINVLQDEGRIREPILGRLVASPAATPITPASAAPTITETVEADVEGTLTRESIAAMDFRDLQTLAKKHGINARQKHEVLVDAVCDKLGLDASGDDAPEAEVEVEVDAEVEVEPEPAPAPKPTPKPAAKPAPTAARPSGSVAKPSTPASTGEVPAAVMKHFEDFIRDFGGANRTIVVVNNAIEESSVVNALSITEADIKTHGDKDEAIRQKLYDFMDAAVQQGILQWEGQFATVNGTRQPPKKIVWAGA